ncbi:MAG: hypothetical protein P1U56_10005 [Saprospiraceae bacterium]|nr:hypothetical protein [Saprospiraceae bacterium]
MKQRILLLFLIISSIASSQDCDPITANSTFIHGNMEFKLLNGGQTFNALNYKVGIGSDGDLNSRSYSPIIYASDIWAGGIDPNANLVLAAGGYTDRDWATGPLDEFGMTTPEKCDFWDQVFTVTKEEIYEAWKVYKNEGPCDDIPESVLNWPARGNPFLPQLSDTRLADFFDFDGTAQYDPCNGDLPGVTIRGSEPLSIVDYFAKLPSKISFYMLNDAGRPHNYSNGAAVPLKVWVYVFSYDTEETKDIIFTKYKSTYYGYDDLIDFHLGHWFDFDLGCKENDLMGTDDGRNMVYAYNSSVDGPCVDSNTPLPNSQFGVSYLNGMFQPYIIVDNNGVDSLVTPPIGSGLLDTLVRVKMSTSVIPYDCKNTSQPNACKPENPTEFHNILKGLNTDGSSILGPDGQPTLKMFTGNPTDAASWTLCAENETPETTVITSSKSQLLNPGATNEILLAYCHATDGVDGCPDISALQYRQDQAQKFYENNFFHYTGPNPPLLDISKTTAGLEISIHAIPYDYKEMIPEAYAFEDNSYVFEGIKIYQVKSSNFDLTELDNPELSALVYQGDIDNSIDNIFNTMVEFNAGVKSYVPTQKVEGQNSGILEQFTFDYDILEDLPIIDGKPYYFVAVSYAHNNYATFDSIAETGQQYPYLQGSCGVKAVNSELVLSSKTLPEIKPYLFQNDGQNWSFQAKEARLNISLLASNGIEIKKWNLDKEESIYSSDINALIPGVYFLRINSLSQGRTYGQKIVHIL